MRYLLIAGFLFISGCAEFQMYNPKEDCSGRTERLTTPGYPCTCCKFGE